MNRILPSPSEDLSELVRHAILVMRCHHVCLLHGQHHRLHPVLYLWLLSHHLHLLLWHHLLLHALLSPLMLHWLHHWLYRLLCRWLCNHIRRPGLLRPLYECRNSQADAPGLDWQDLSLSILWVASHYVVADGGCHMVGMA